MPLRLTSGQQFGVRLQWFQWPPMKILCRHHCSTFSLSFFGGKGKKERKKERNPINSHQWAGTNSANGRQCKKKLTVGGVPPMAANGLQRSPDCWCLPMGPEGPDCDCDCLIGGTIFIHTPPHDGVRQMQWPNHHSFEKYVSLKFFCDANCCRRLSCIFLSNKKNQQFELSQEPSCQVQLEVKGLFFKKKKKKKNKAS